jgi:hypothetical protein
MAASVFNLRSFEYAFMWNILMQVRYLRKPLLEQIRAEDPAYPDREGLLASAREALERERKVAAIYAKAQRHMDAREWQQAIERLEEVRQLEPGHRDVDALLAQARYEGSHRTPADTPPTQQTEGDQRQSAQHSIFGFVRTFYPQPANQELPSFPAPYRLAWYLTTVLVSLPGVVLFVLSPALESLGGTAQVSSIGNSWIVNFAFVYLATSIVAYKYPIGWRFATAFTVLPHVPFLVINFAAILEDFEIITPTAVLATIGTDVGALAVFVLPNALIVSIISVRRRHRPDTNT